MSSQKKSNFLGSLHLAGFFCLLLRKVLLFLRLERKKLFFTANAGCWRPCNEGDFFFLFVIIHEEYRLFRFFPTLECCTLQLGK